MRPRASTRGEWFALTLGLSIAASACGLSLEGTFEGDAGAPLDATTANDANPLSADGNVADGGMIVGEGGPTMTEAGSDAAPSDAATEAAVAACASSCPVDAGGVCVLGTCQFNCITAGACNDPVCPPGIPCSINCLKGGGCGGSINCGLASSCNITCGNTNACGPIICDGNVPPGDGGSTTSSCTVNCLASNACAAIKANAGSSVIDCLQNNACTDVTCGGAACTVDCAGNGCNTVECCASVCLLDAKQGGICN